MNILIIGKGGREHAMAWKCKQNKSVNTIFVAPGNKGMKDVATLVPIIETDVVALLAFAKEKKIDLTIVGPETSLEKGIADVFLHAGLPIFAPTKAASKIEWSKDYCKSIMKKYAIPTADYETFLDATNAIAYIKNQQAPFVIKEDGLKAGKGVTIAYTLDEAESTIHAAFEQEGNKIVIEEFLDGFEYSLIAFVHENRVIPFEVAQDHKRAHDGDRGLNTGGMGVYSPVKKITPTIIEQTMQQVMQPMADAMCKEGIPFTGFLYGGLMLTQKGIKTIEFNARFGDPEAEILLPRLQTDFIEVIQHVMNKKNIALEFDHNAYVGVVMASENYPEGDTKGAVIKGLEQTTELVFHMGTDEKNNQWITNGGRVLCVVAKGQTLQDAKEKAYQQVNNIHCDKLFYRTDIGAKDE